MAAAAGAAAAAGLWSEVNRCGQNGDFARALKSVNKSECGGSAGPRAAGLGSLPGRVGLAEGRCGAAGSGRCPSVGFVPGAEPRAKAAGILLCWARGKRGGRGPGSAAVPRPSGPCVESRIPSCGLSSRSCLWVSLPFWSWEEEGLFPRELEEWWCAYGLTTTCSKRRVHVEMCCFGG